MRSLGRGTDDLRVGIDALGRAAFGSSNLRRHLCDSILPRRDESAIRLVPMPEKGEPARDYGEGGDDGDDDPEAPRVLRQWNAADIHP